MTYYGQKAFDHILIRKILLLPTKCLLYDIFLPHLGSFQNIREEGTNKS